MESGISIRYRRYETEDGYRQEVIYTPLILDVSWVYEWYDKWQYREQLEMDNEGAD